MTYLFDPTCSDLIQPNLIHLPICLSRFLFQCNLIDLSLDSLCFYLAILLSTYLSYRYICVSVYVCIGLPI